MVDDAVRARSVFLSYSRHDFYLAEQVRELLTEAGLTVWMDLAELEPGHDWKSHTNGAIAGADALVLIATPASVASKFVRKEYRRAGSVRVLLADACPLPPVLGLSPVYDGRTRLQSAVHELAADITGSPIPARRTRRGLAVPVALAGFGLTALVAAATAVAYLTAIDSEPRDNTLIPSDRHGACIWPAPGELRRPC